MLQKENNDIPNNFLYNGERSDFNTVLQYLRARFYSLNIKRFLNKDDYGLLNRFNYVNANPIENIDPTGHMKEWVLDTAIIFYQGHTIDEHEVRKITVVDGQPMYF